MSQFQTVISSRLTACLICLLTLAFTLNAFSGEVRKVKGKAVIIGIDGLSVSEGDRIFAMDSNGKKVGLIQITKIKGQRAAGKILKGRASEGMELAQKGGKGSRGSKSASGESSGGPTSGTLRIGGLASFAMDTMKIKARNSAGTITEDVPTSGNGFGANAVGDFYFSPMVSVRALAGIETFKATGKSTRALCTNSVNCDTSITYFDITGLLRYHVLDESSFPIWLGLGAGFYFPMGSTSNVIEGKSISTASLITGGLGSDIKIGDNMYLPLQFDYSVFFPASDDVSTNIISIRAGILFKF